ncbi:MAG TPA: hypothetical protein VN836_09125 [Verrucomicrobiae bacterium]|nr:hypothetical protein [Verrucomicrobiae bacterium]
MNNPAASNRMTETPNQTEPSEGGLNWEIFFPVVLALVVGAMAITSQSFWMDECSTAILAVQPTFAAWRHSLMLDAGANNQMPIYMFHVWVWQKLFDNSELALRASNLSWLALGFLAIPRRQALFLFTLATSSFLWYYLNEFRPYVALISSALLMLGAVWHLVEMPEKPENKTQELIWVGCFCLGMVLLSGVSLIGVIWTAAGVGAATAVLGRERGRQLLWRHLPIFMGTAAPMLLLAIYYVVSLENGHRAVSGSTGLGNAVFIMYELTGFTGLGPGRLEIRAGGAAAFLPFIAPLLVYATVLACILFAGGKYILQNFPRRVWLGVTAAFGAAAVFLLLVGVVTDFRVLGRHFSPLLLGVLLVIYSGLRDWEQRGGWRRLMVALFLLLSLTSALSARFGERHAKDDNRAAATVARTAFAGKKNVWWCTDGGSGYWYGLPLVPAKTNTVAPGRIWWVADPPPEWLTNAAPPDLLILCKPELFDRSGETRAFLERNHYHLTQKFQAFTLWQPQSK